MLRNIGTELKKNYYDPTFGGRDLDAHLKTALEKLDQVTSLGQAMGVIAQALVDLNDSHTFFVPPNRTVKVEYGWRMQMIGQDCYVTAVRPGSDAAVKGLKSGDQILAIDGFRPSRSELWKLEYSYNVLSPRSGATLSVKSPGGAPRELEVASQVTRGKRILDLTGADGGVDIDAIIREAEDNDSLRRHRLQKLGTIAVWKMSDFSFANHDEMLRWALKDADALILDMRGNSGGYVKTLEEVTSRFFDREFTIAELKGRKRMDPIRAKKTGRTFTGRIVALIDSRSASAAELLARVLQLEKRGVVVGDRSSGAVMQAYGFSGKVGSDRLVFYAASITNADVIMPDGQSLERAGVIPDEQLTPSGEDLAAGRDPILARAAAILDVKLDPVTAGKMFPFEWK